MTFFLSFISYHEGVCLEKEDIAGKWLIVSFSEMDLPDDQKTFYVFYDDGAFIKKMIVYDYEEEQRGSWKLEKNSLMLSFPTSSKIVIYDLRFEGESLVLRRLGMTTRLKKTQ